jgi:L-seryl-tRNA(Ser) seleniumtransferase
MNELLRKIPKVDEIMKDGAWGRLAIYPEALVKDNLRDVLDELRADLKEGRAGEVPPTGALIDRTEARVTRFLSPTLKKVVNGTGVVIHTNLGRSPLAPDAIERLTETASGYSNLEYHLKEGKRGDRHSHCLAVLSRLTGAESAIIVNNNAAAVLLVLNTFAQGKEVIIGRGELIEIGGSFRIPEVMKKSGAILREVGTTNRTFIEDYEQAINEETGLIMKAHTSNYRIRGFVHEAASEELAALSARHDVPFFFDAGSGLLSPFANLSRFGEPVIQEEVAKGAGILSFSGDKLLGGPQAGIILGRKPLIDAMKRNPITRALRPDKFTLAALEATLLLYLDEEKAKREIPILRMLNAGEDELKRRAQKIARRVRAAASEAAVDVVRLESEVGGGSLPDVQLPSYGLSILPTNMTTEAFEQHLRLGDGESFRRKTQNKFRRNLQGKTPSGVLLGKTQGVLPVVGRIEKGRFLVDVRTVLEEEERDLVLAIGAALADGK